MKLPLSLQNRLGLSLGALLTAIWIGAAAVTAVLAHDAIEKVFDSALQETAQRILPLAVADILGREEEGMTQRLAEIREHDEFLTYVVRDAQGRILLQSHDADSSVFPAWDGIGFRQSTTHRYYNEQAVQGSVRITIAEPLAHRTTVAREIQMGLGLPLLIFLPVALLTIVFAVRVSLAPLRRFRNTLATRGERDLSLVPGDGLPVEVSPVADTLNELLGRLAAAFEAERSFAANAAHELRTPLAGAIAQIQRLQTETREPETRLRATDIETTLKRLTRLSERLMQLARAEGGRLRLDRISDLRPVAHILTEDLSRIVGSERITLELPASPLMSDLDPDVFAIVYRNLIENAMRHGAVETPVRVTLAKDGLLTVANDGPVVPEELLHRLTDRFVHGGIGTDGSGLGLAIVNSVAQRIGTVLHLKSPRTGQSTGFEVSLTLPLAQCPCDSDSA
ncbi:ATP-binding protein [Chitinimonas sp. BJB300]|uniref:ATP-binding protein n=1 Tax=Chitinimonas sp. BJB300 TaxID=1559339 RepID=UPI000C0CF56D|nr:ATP-binding protein [Chitinimonas sp. BJB300]PHV10418.1 two-component sensor histidine kinase [Chitinimonas sp. BJB300]TSJ83309.1 two-component sensor histidine kinase [Chitinimonas sp. BJB300]